MDYDRLALFLAGYTTGGFRRSLRTTPQATLVKCGFNPGEAALLAASVAKHSRANDTYEVTRVQFAFQKINEPHKNPNVGMTDDWATRC
ncbi:MAG TPA: hypothetical protein VGR70_22050 [Stellaceae bacterium]|nr:hypothetical protein [Stellaceae bacterium]